MNAACCNTTPDITNVLLQHGGDATLSDDDNCTAVIMACGDSDQHLPVLRAMMSHHTGARVQLEDRNSNSWTAVMMAVVRNSPGCLRLLLNMGASTDGRYRSGRTVMEMARGNGSTEVIRVLEDHSKRTGELLVVFRFIQQL